MIAEALIILIVGTPALAVLVNAVVKANSAAASYAAEKARRAVKAAEGLRSIAQGDYLRTSNVESWRREHPNPAGLLLSDRERSRLRDTEVRDSYAEAVVTLGDADAWVSSRNKAYVESRLDELTSWFDGRLPTPLTEQQRRAVVIDEDCNLVVASAGSGKTSTIIAKVAYLVEQRHVDPAEILVLAFNKSVAKEIGAHLHELGISAPDVSTFHAKGFKILGQAKGRKPAISALADDPQELGRFLQRQFKSKLSEPTFLEPFSRWWVEKRVEAQDFEACTTPDERLRKERSLGLRTLDGTRVRSQSEVKIGDWLTLNGIPWEHERRYPHAPPSPTRRDYTPDFYLPRHEVWIEVWACAEAEEQFPPEVDAVRYRADMRWKRNLHEQEGTVLVEVFQNEIWGGRLGEILVEKLTAAQIPTVPLSPVEVEDLLASIGESRNPFVRLIRSFLGLYRAGGWTREAVAQRIRSPRDRDFLQLFWRFLTDYEQALEEEGKIDYDAMLIEAAQALAKGFNAKRYQYILVDEFQDTSRARLGLIQQLRRETASCRLFLVGDDWQSIYRFTGSDIDYFTKVSEHLGAMARTTLDRTFRLLSDVSELSTHFITKNDAQLPKQIFPRAKSLTAGVSIRFHARERETETLLETLREIADACEHQASVLLLGRYNHRLSVVDAIRPGIDKKLQLKVLTVHSAKGLEADHVVIVGLDSGQHGFPSEIEDDRVLQMLLGADEEYPNAEERRLFYVGLTRTKSRVHLLADSQEPSPFVQELLADEYADWIDFFGGESVRYRCPRCAGRTIRRREGKYGSFWGCIHHPACRGRLPICPECGIGVVEPPKASSLTIVYRCSHCTLTAEVCPLCKVGALIRKEGSYGPFLGCSEWRRGDGGCEYTRNLDPTEDEPQ